MAENGTSPEPAPQGPVASAAREVGAVFRSRWEPQQAVLVSFVVMLAVILGMLGWRVWSDDKTRIADREASIAAQAQLLRFTESETEKGRLFFAVETEKGRQFHSAENDKIIRHGAAMDKARRDESAIHAKEAWDELSKLRVTLAELKASVDKLKGKAVIPDEPSEPKP